MNKQTVLTRTALLLAITLIFQSLRFFFPIPPLASTFLIGTLVNATLLIALDATGLKPALMLCIITPLVAYFQQLLFLPVFIFPVAAGNLFYVALFHRLRRTNGGFAGLLAASGKAMVLYLSFSWLLIWVNIPAKLGVALLFAMSWPQFVTALGGVAIANVVTRKLRNL